MGSSSDTKSATPKETIKESIKENSVVNELIITKESVLDSYRESIGEPGEDMENEIALACMKFTPEWVADAIQEAVKRGRKDWYYIAGILKNWNRYGKGAKGKGRQDPDKYVKGRYGKNVKR